MARRMKPKGKSRGRTPLASLSARRRRPPHKRPPAPKRWVGNAPEAEGRFMGNRRGFGFVLRDGGADVFIPAPLTHGALDGDSVRIAVLREGERPEGEVLEITARASTTVIGTVVRAEGREGGLLLEPDSPRLPTFPLPTHGRARLGDKIEARLSPSGREVSFLRSFGRANTRTANYAAILAECAVPTDFSADALAEAREVAAQPLTEEGRRCFRGAVLTIDGEGAKDLDDAVSLRVLGEGFVLSVHIADVSHYVRPGTALDRAAHERGSSVYFADRVVPMLPEDLSNGACSLNAGEDKYALTAEMTLAADGRILKTRLYRSMIRSRVRGVYREVNDLFEKGSSSPYYEKYAGVFPMLLKMRELFVILAEADRRRGILELETGEPVITLGEDGDPVDIVRAERGEAERLIEAFMLTANRGVAELLHSREIPCVYRVHEPPPTEKYGELSEYLTALSLPLPWRRGETPSAAGLRRVLAAAEERGLAAPVSYSILRSMAKARYAATPLSHFGLSLSLYCHFTSPIRRLSDLVTHRIIEAVLLDGEPTRRYRAAAHRGADAATEGELRALTAERRIEALYKTLYMKRHIGERFSGVVSSVTPHGYYVELANTCEGL
ncbi:MAG: VacB/RNase II family 3'-5' exoribonuclease, partial [Clostridia bacterium]|nr:VacB/RNase II family 3'-5' exoribonuclease [Clostridia bacterium]